MTNYTVVKFNAFERSDDDVIMSISALQSSTEHPKDSAYRLV